MANEPTRLTSQPVSTRWGERQIEIWRGDLLQVPVDQWVFSAFQGSYYPTRRTIWEAAWKRFSTALTDQGRSLPCPWGEPQEVGGRTDVVAFDTAEAFGQEHPLVVLHMRSGAIDAEHGVSTLGLGRLFHELLFALQALDQQGRLAGSIGLPLLGTGSQGLPVASVVPPLKEFASNALSTTPSLERVVLCAFSDNEAADLEDAFRTVVGRRARTRQQEMKPWLKQSIVALVSIIRAKGHVLKDGVAADHLAELIERLGYDDLDLEGIAISARTLLAAWLGEAIESADRAKRSRSLVGRVDSLNGLFGTPNSHISYLHLLRVISNSAAHGEVAVKRVTPEDIVGILLGVDSLLELARLAAATGESGQA